MFELLEKMYSDFSARFDKIEDEIKNNRILLENVQKNVETLAEVHKSDFEHNQRNHEEIVEMLSERIHTTEKAIKAIK